MPGEATLCRLIEVTYTIPDSASVPRTRYLDNTIITHPSNYRIVLEEASTHKSAKTNAGTVFCDS